MERRRAAAAAADSAAPARGRRAAAPLAGVCAFALAAAAGGCRKPAADEAPPAPSAPPLASAPARVDTVAPDEIPEGTEAVFGIKLPRGFVVTGNFGDGARAKGRLSPPRLTSYLKARVRDGVLETKPGSITFDKAHAPDSPFRDLFIEITEDRFKDETVLVVKDVTPKPDPTPQLDDEARWKAAGFKPPYGEPVDPAKFY